MGAFCCTLRGDLIREIQRIRETGKFDYVLIESTGIAEPQNVAESFCVDPETKQVAGDEEHMLWNSARLDTCVTVVDTFNFPKYMSSLKRFKDVFTDGLDETEEGEGEKSISELMVEQVEFSNVIILNKIDLASKANVDTTKKLIHTLNPKARVLEASYGKIDVANILNTNLFNMEKASESPGWLQSLENGVDAEEGEADEYGVSSFVYRARKPFHPNRLYCFLSQFFSFAQDWCNADSDTEEVLDKTLEEKYGSILRSKGTCWIAGRDNHEMSWAQVGRLLSITPSNPWYCESSQEELEEDVESEEEMTRIQSLFYNAEDESNKYEYGDRRQELVFIGTKLSKKEIIDGLEACLLSEEEMSEHTPDLPAGTYVDPLHPILIDCQGASSLFAIARPNQNQHIHIFRGFKLSLQNMALDISEECYESIKAVKVYLDKSDKVKQGVLLGSLVPNRNEQISLSVDLMPCDVEAGEEDTHRRIRVEVVLNRGHSKPTGIREGCEVHFIGKVEPLPYAEGSDDEEEDEDMDCYDGTCPAAAA